MVEKTAGALNDVNTLSQTVLDSDSESMQKYQAATNKAEGNKDDIDALAAKVDTATTNANDINAKVLDKVST